MWYRSILFIWDVIFYLIIGFVCAYCLITIQEKIMDVTHTSKKGRIIFSILCTIMFTGTTIYKKYFK